MILNIPTLENFCINTCFGLLLTSTIYYWSQIFFSRDTSQSKLGLLGSSGSALFLTIHLLLRWIDSGHFPLSNLYESLLFLTWCLLILLVYLEIVLNTLFLGVLLSPALLCLIAFTDFSLPPELQKSSPLVPALQSNWLVMHVTVMIASYAALLFGCLVAIAYLLFSRWSNHSSAPTAVQNTQRVLYGNTRFSFSSQELLAKSQTDTVLGTPSSNFGAKLDISTSEPSDFLLAEGADVQELKNAMEDPDLKNMIKDQGPNPFYKEIQGKTFSQDSSPDKNRAVLTFLDNISYRTIGIGFCFLTLGILSGAVWANETWGNYWSWDPKETWALITWLTFATYLHSRLVGGWAGSKPAWIASFGFFIVWICYLGVNLLGQGLHSYGFLDFE